MSGTTSHAQEGRRTSVMGGDPSTVTSERPSGGSMRSRNRSSGLTNGSTDPVEKEVVKEDEPEPAPKKKSAKKKTSTSVERQTSDVVEGLNADVVNADPLSSATSKNATEHPNEDKGKMSTLLSSLTELADAPVETEIQASSVPPSDERSLIKGKGKAAIQNQKPSLYELAEALAERQ